MNADARAIMGFTLPKDVEQDTERKDRLRANMQSATNYEEAAKFADLRTCELHDLSTGKYDIDFHQKGFDAVSIAENKKLQALLEKVKAQGVFDQGDEQALRKAVVGSVLKLSNGKKMRMVFVASEGIIIRSSGPNGLQIQHGKAVAVNSRQSAALLMHGDQDVYGFPLKRIMKGAAPWVFRHKTPDGENNFSPVNLVNIWIPMQQTVMPLCLMDRSTLDNKKQQLRLMINVKDVLGRSKDSGRNDIWSFLYDDKQQWYFKSDMSHNEALVFDTLGMCHGAATLEGEKQAEEYFLRLSQCLEALDANNEIEFKSIATKEKLKLPEKLTLGLKLAIEKMESLLNHAATETQSVMKDGSSWKAEAEKVLQSLIRKSIELRAVGLIL